MKLRLMAMVMLLIVALAAVGYSEPPSAVSNLNLSGGIITRQEARWIYTLKTRFWFDGTRITLVHLPFDNRIHQEFVRGVLEMQPAMYTKQLQVNLNSGNGVLAKEAKNLDQMMDYVQNKPGAIGYLTADYLIVNGIGHVDVLKIVD